MTYSDSYALMYNKRLDKLGFHRPNCIKKPHLLYFLTQLNTKKHSASYTSFIAVNVRHIKLYRHTVALNEHKVYGRT